MLLNSAKYLMVENQLSSRPDYAHVVELSFSTSKNARWRKYSNFMKFLCNVSLCVTQLGFCCVYLVFVSKSVKIILDYYGCVIDLKIIMVIVLIPTLAQSLVRQLKNIGKFIECHLILAPSSSQFTFSLPPLQPYFPVLQTFA
jgi:proton-coupled amino acid transporter